MIVEVYVNGIKRIVESKESSYSKAINEIRKDIKNEYKLNNERRCELWFTNIIKN